jgi:hypothetical protein
MSDVCVRKVFSSSVAYVPLETAIIVKDLFVVASPQLCPFTYNDPRFVQYLCGKGIRVFVKEVIVERGDEKSFCFYPVTCWE